MHGLLWHLSLQTWHSSWFCITLSSDFSRFKIECLLEKEPAQFFLRSRPKLHIRFINLLYLPCRKFVQSQNMHQNPSAMFLVASRVHLILYLHYLLYYIAIFMSIYYKNTVFIHKSHGLLYWDIWLRFPLDNVEHTWPFLCCLNNTLNLTIFVNREKFYGETTTP